MNGITLPEGVEFHGAQRGMRKTLLCFTDLGTGGDFNVSEENCTTATVAEAHRKHLERFAQQSPFMSSKADVERMNG